MPRKKHLKAKVTHYPTADIAVGGGRNAIPPEKWTILANDVWQVMQTSINARWALENNLELWYNLCDMQTGGKDTPYVDSSDLFIPLVPSKIEALRDQVASICFVPEFYIVTGLTPEASETAYVAQSYWNNEFRKQRPVCPTWFEQHLNWLHLSLRDGTAIMEVMWSKRTKLTRYGVTMPKTDDDGMPVMDGDDMVQETHNVEKDVVEYNDVLLNVVKLKDFILIPDESRSIRDALGVGRVLWLTEYDLDAMVEDGLLVQEWVDKALSYVPEGITDVSSDWQRHYDKAVGNQLDIGMGQGTTTSEYFANRGPIKVWRIHTRQYDLDGDEIPEENVMWLHDQSGYLLGVVPDEYISPTRPFFDFSPFPRPDEFYGFSLAERLGPFNAEANLQWNQRNDAIDTRMLAPLIMDRMVEIEDKGMQWGLGKLWSVANASGALKDAFYYPQMPDIPLPTFQQESMVRNDADTIAGLNAPMTGGTTSGRKSATEVKISSASGSVRANQIAMLLRLASRSVLEFVRKLKLQYPWEPDPFGMPITPELLAKPYKMDVSGTSDPLDKQASVDEALGAFNLLKDSPVIQGDLMKQYNLARFVCERIGVPNVESILGRPEEIQERVSQQQKMSAEEVDLKKRDAEATINEKNFKAGIPPPQQGQPQGGPPQPPGPLQPSPNGQPQLTPQ